MDNQIQQTIQEVKEAQELATDKGKWIYNGNEIVGISNTRCGIGGFLTDEDNLFVLALCRNVPQLMGALEQQQREIERLQGLVDESRGVTKQIVELYFQGNHFANVHPMFDEAQTLLNLLFPKEDQTPPEMGMTRSDRSQIDDLIKEYGADFILDYVNDYAEKEVLGDVQDDRKAD